MVFILGVNAFHADASAALIKDGKILSAVEEERFKRIKHCAGFPNDSIKWCLRDAGISISDIDHIAINSKPSSNYFRKIKYVLTSIPSPQFLLSKWINKKQRADISKEIFIPHTFLP